MRRSPCSQNRRSPRAAALSSPNCKPRATQASGDESGPTAIAGWGEDSWGGAAPPAQPYERQLAPLPLRQGQCALEDRALPLRRSPALTRFAGRKENAPAAPLARANTGGGCRPHHTNTPLAAISTALSVPQAMVLTHEGAPVEERMPYHNVRMRGLRPLIFSGRCAAAAPAASVRGCMFNFYRDRGGLGKRCLLPCALLPSRLQEILFRYATT